MKASDTPKDTYTPEQRAEMLAKMQETASWFYVHAVRTGVHAFIEFAGLMNEFIKVCKQADDEGIDFTQANTHSSTDLPFEIYNVGYLAEKLNCIYGPGLLVNEQLRDAFIHQLFEGRYLLVPVRRPSDGWRKMTSDDRMSRDWKCDECEDRAMFLREKGEGNNRKITAHRCLFHMDFGALAQLAKNAFDQLSPEEQKKHRRDQAVSWIYNTLKLDGSKVTETQVARIVDERMASWFSDDRGKQPQSPG